MSKKWRNGDRKIACFEAFLLILKQAQWGDTREGMRCLRSQFGMRASSYTPPSSMLVFLLQYTSSSCLIQLFNNLLASEISSKNRHWYNINIKVGNINIININIKPKFCLFSELDHMLAISCSGVKKHPKLLYNTIFQNYIKANFILLFHE